MGVDVHSLDARALHMDLAPFAVGMGVPAPRAARIRRAEFAADETDIRWTDAHGVSPR